MRLAADLAGFTLGEADTLRKAMGKKDRELMAQQREQVHQGLPGQPDRGPEGRAHLGADREVRGLRLQQVSHRRHLDRDGGRRAEADHRGPRRRSGAHEGRPVPCARRAAERRAPGGPAPPRQRDVRALHPDHPIFTQRGWVNAEELAAGRSRGGGPLASRGPGGGSGPQGRPAGLCPVRGEPRIRQSLLSASRAAPKSSRVWPDRCSGVSEHRRPRERRTDGRAASVRPARLDRGAPSEAVSFLFETCGLQRQGGPRQARACAGRPLGSEKHWRFSWPSSSRATAAFTRRLARSTTRPRPSGWPKMFGGCCSSSGSSSTVHRSPSRYRGELGAGLHGQSGRRAFRVRPFRRRWSGPHLVGPPNAVSSKHSSAAYAGLAPLLARGTVDVVPLALCSGRAARSDAEVVSEPQGRLPRRSVSPTGSCSRTTGKGAFAATRWPPRPRLDSPTLDALADAPDRAGPGRGATRAKARSRPTTSRCPVGARASSPTGSPSTTPTPRATALVAYQTAYLKANYPVEFMAALLTSEMDKTDKIVQYMDECRAHGARGRAARRQPLGRRSFTVEGDTHPLRPGRHQERGRDGDRVDRARSAQESGAFTVARRLLRARRPAARQPARDREPHQGGRLRLASAARGPASWPRSTRPWRRASAASGSARKGRARSSTRWSRAERRGRGRRASAVSSPRPSRMATRPAPQLREGGARLLPVRPPPRALPRHGAPARQSRRRRARRRPVGARVACSARSSQVRERATKSGNRMAFATLEAVDGAVALTIFPGAAQDLRARAAAPRAGPGQGPHRRHRQGPGGPDRGDQRATGGRADGPTGGAGERQRRARAPRNGERQRARSHLPHPGPGRRAAHRGRYSPRCARSARRIPARPRCSSTCCSPSTRWW